MPPLENTRHEAFCQNRAKGLTADAAYQAAGYKPSRPCASRLSTKANICARIAELQARVAQKTEYTVEKIAGMLGEVHRKSVEAGDRLNERQSAMDLAKLHGLIVDQAHVRREGTDVVRVYSDRPLTDDEWEQRFGAGEALRPGVDAADRPAGSLN